MSGNVFSGITIKSFMLNYGLKGNELLVYACIYSFTDRGEWFEKSAQWITRWTNCTRQTVLYCLNALVSRGLIEKRSETINEVKFCKYRIIDNGYVL